MSVPAFIPSKDRAASCDLLLTSLGKNAPYLFSPTVMYTYSNADFKLGYELLKKKWPEIDFQYEQNHEEQFYKFLSNNGLICLFADDCIFYRQCIVWEDDLKDFFSNEDVFSFSYRIGKNVTVKDYVTGEQPIQPQDIQEDGVMQWWDCTQVDFWQLHGFAVGFDGYVYRAKDLLELSQRSSFPRICEWEHMICRKYLDKRPTAFLIGSPTRSCIFVQQVNTVHGLLHRTNHQYNISPEELNRRWLNGQEIYLDEMDFSSVNCTHGEIPYKFKERMEYATFV